MSARKTVEPIQATRTAPTDGDPREQNISPRFGSSRKAALDLLEALGRDVRAAARPLAASLARRYQDLPAMRRAIAARLSLPRLSLPRRKGAASSDTSEPPVPASPIPGIGSLRLPALRRHGLTWKRALVASALACLLIFGAVLTWALSDVPWRDIAEGTQKPVVVLQTADAKPLVTQGPYRGPYVRYEQFPPRLIDAVLSIEDRRFMEHYGVDLRGIGRAFLRNFQAGSVVQGGSTITQQLIKLQYLERDRSLKRKIQEVVIALWLEWKLGKQEILTRYLNSVYLGAGATGMSAASRIYFNRELSDLDLPQVAMLAGLLKAPSQLNPLEDPEASRERTAVVLQAMADNGKISQQEAKAAQTKFARLQPTAPTPRSGSWFADWIAPQASEIAGDAPGSTTVKTTLSPRLQQIAERVVRQALDKEGKKVGASQAALVAMTPEGAVVAMVGGHDYKSSQFNRATLAKRQPGSTFKLFVFYAALKEGLTPADRVLDAPIDIDGWQPKNSGETYRGWVTLAEAFARSLNSATATLAQEVGMEKVVAAAKELGIDADLAVTPSLALGTSELTLIDLTGAYASVLLGKAPVQPWGIVDFKGMDQPRPFRVGPQTRPEIDLSPYQEDLLSLLQLVVERGTGKSADPGVAAAGKTGTSQDNRDAWFVGFTQKLVVGVWVGNDDNSPMKGVTGGELPARIWRAFMQEALKASAPANENEAETDENAVSSGPSCNIRACSRSYRSFRASDCTYQPYRGERRICEK